MGAYMSSISSLFQFSCSTGWESLTNCFGLMFSDPGAIAITLKPARLKVDNLFFIFSDYASKLTKVHNKAMLLKRFLILFTRSTMLSLTVDSVVMCYSSKS